MRTPDEEMGIIESIIWKIAKHEEDSWALVTEMRYMCSLYKCAKYRKKAWYEANKDKVAARQKNIALVRKARGMTQSGLAAIVGVTQATVSLWETGAVKANWDKLCAALPELETYRA